MKIASFYATIAYGIITLLALFVTGLYYGDIYAIALSILAMALSYVSQGFYTNAIDKPQLQKWGHFFMIGAVTAGVCAGIFILWGAGHG